MEILLGMGGHGYGGAGDASSGFHGGHFVHMRGLPFRATENDIANVSNFSNSFVLVYNFEAFLNVRFYSFNVKFSKLNDIYPYH